MPNRLRVLLLEDREADAKLVVRELERAGLDPLWERVETEEDFVRHLDPAPDLILADYSLPQFDALQAVRLVRGRSLDTPFIIVSGTIGEERAAEAMREGADDYLLKDRLGRLGRAVSNAVERYRLAAAERRAATQMRLQVAAMTAAADAIVITDRDGTIRWVNPAFTQLTGYESGEALGRNPRFLKSDRQPPEVYRKLWETILAGHTWRGELVNRRKDGSCYEELQSITPVRGEHGEVEAFVAIKQDMTERKREEQELAERARLGTLAGAVGLGLLSARTVESMVQSSVDALVAGLDAALAEVWILDDHANLLEHRASAGPFARDDATYTALRPGESEVGRIASDRRSRVTNDLRADPDVPDHAWARSAGLVAFVGLPLQAAARCVGVLTVYFREPVTGATVRALEAVGDRIATHLEVLRADQAVLAARDRLHHVVSSSPSVLWTLAVAGNELMPTWVSENIQSVLGYTVAEVEKPTWWRDHVFPEDLEDARRGIQEQLFAAGSLTQSYRFRHRNGDYRWIRSDLRLQRDVLGQPVEVVCAWSDITELKALEDRFRHAQKMEAIGKLAGGVAHDFNNLLTVINGYGQLLMRSLPESDASRAAVAEMVDAGERAVSLTRQLLAFSRKAIIQPVVLDLAALVASLEKMIRRLVGEDIQMTVECEAGLGTVRADPGQLEQVILNLVVNARDAMPTGGALTIRMRNVELTPDQARREGDVQPGAYVELAVRDAGCGMSAAVLERIFEPFFTTKGSQGTGLGLATVHGIVEQCGGYLHVESAVGHGSTFEVRLPRFDAPDESSVRREAPGNSLPRGTETVLVVEDQPEVRLLARRVLELCGYEVLEAVDGHQALQVADQHRAAIDVLLSDIVMPGMSGPQVADALRLSLPGIKVLFMSGYTDDAVVRHGVRQVEVAFLQKPFTPKALATTIRALLDAPPVTPTERSVP